MDYKDKYLKYKTKYLKLKNINLVGGEDKTKLNESNTEIVSEVFENNGSNKITNTDILDLMSRAYGQTYTEFTPNSALNGNALVYKLFYVPENKLVGLAVATNLDQFKSDDGFEDQGGIIDKLGLFITSVAGDSNFSGVVGLLFNQIISDAESSDVDYLLLQAKKYEPVDYLVSLYKKSGFSGT